MTGNGAVRVPTITVITPCYNEEAALPQYFREVERTLFACADAEFHLLLIDDGSADRTWDLIQEACKGSPRYRGLRLSRNFGSHAAATAGFDFADGDAVAILPADLQEPPETVVEFVARWRAGADVVWGKRRSRAESRWRVLASRIVGHLARRLVMPRGSKFTTGSFLLIDHKVVMCLRQLREHNRVIFGLVAWTGFEQDVVEYDRAARTAGRSSWNVSRMLRSLYDVFMGFSDVVPRLITFLGVGFALIGFVASLTLLVTFLITPPQAPGWGSMIVVLTLFFGATFLILGIMSEYLSRIYQDSARRPLYFIASDTAAPDERRVRRSPEQDS
jgi:glycosyltransferase involved in cell wall biosynthesis